MIEIKKFWALEDLSVVYLIRSEDGFYNNKN